MKKTRKLLSVILCIVIIISSFGVLSFAEENTAETETIVTDVTVDDNISDIEENPDVENPEEVVPDEPQEKKSYIECVATSAVIGVYLISGVVELPLSVATLSIAFVPFAPFLALALPIAAVGGAGVSVAGVFAILLSPIIGLVDFLKQ